MADLNPILSWNRRTLGILVEDSNQQKNFYEGLSLASHTGPIIFGTGSLKSLADSVAAQCRKHEAIYRNLDVELDNVPELLGSRVLIAQWHALYPVGAEAFVLPEQLLTPEE